MTQHYQWKQTQEKGLRSRTNCLFSKSNYLISKLLLNLIMTVEHRKGKKHWVKYSTQNIHIIYGFQYLAKIGPSSFMVYSSLTQFNLVITCDFLQ